jgi:hypothetical protein
MIRDEPPAERLLRAEEMRKVCARVDAADAAVAVLVERAEVACVGRVAQIVFRAPPGQDAAVTSAARRIDAIEQIDAAVDPGEQIAHGADTHQVTRFVRRQQGRRHTGDPIHLGARLADGKSADRIAGKIQRDELACAAGAQVVFESALDDPEKQRGPAPPGRSRTLRPQRRPCDGCGDLVARRRQLDALIEHHRDVDAESFLKRDDAFGREAVRRAVEMRAKGDAVIVDAAARLEAEDLKAARIRQERAVPGHEAV